MKKDIQDKNDIILLVNHFYKSVKSNNVLAAHFESVDWVTHLPLMYNFWEHMLFYKGSYSGNPMQTHQNIHKHKPISSAQFEAWRKLFTETVNDLFEGEMANLAIQRALSMATVMEIKLMHG